MSGVVEAAGEACTIGTFTLCVRLVRQCCLPCFGASAPPQALVWHPVIPKSKGVFPFDAVVRALEPAQNGPVLATNDQNSSLPESQLICNAIFSVGMQRSTPMLALLTRTWLALTDAGHFCCR